MGQSAPSVLNITFVTAFCVQTDVLCHGLKYVSCSCFSDYIDVGWVQITTK